MWYLGPSRTYDNNHRFLTNITHFLNARYSTTDLTYVLYHLFFRVADTVCIAMSILQIKKLRFRASETEVPLAPTQVVEPGF